MGFPCEDYKELNYQLNCQAKDYLMSYGYKYCKKFENTINEKLSAQAQAWSKKTKKCLISNLKDFIKYNSPSCKELSSFAITDHTKCYIESGFCELKKKDKFVIYKSIDNKFNLSFLSQAVQLNLGCLFKKQGNF